MKSSVVGILSRRRPGRIVGFGAWHGRPAGELSGVTLPDTLKVGGEKMLKLNGLGLRKKAV